MGDLKASQQNQEKGSGIGIQDGEKILDSPTGIVSPAETSFPSLSQSNLQSLFSSEMATLDRVPLFAKLSAAERAQLLGLMQPKVFTAGEKIIIEGDNGAHFFILQSGECNVTKNAPNPVDPEIFLETLSAGDYFGGTLTNQACLINFQ